MSNIWTNFSSEKLIKFIGEDQLTEIETILPVVDPNFKQNDFQKRKVLARIFESFSGADSLRNKSFREELLNSLKPELRLELLNVFNKSADYSYQDFIKEIINKKWLQSEDINKLCKTLEIPLHLVPEHTEPKPVVELLKPLENINNPF